MTPGEFSKKKVAKIALRVVKKFVEEQRPTAFLVTFEFKREAVENSRVVRDLLEYLEEELDGVKVAKSCFAIPSNIPLSRILASIDKITDGGVAIYAFPFRTWEGSGNAKASDWLDEYVPKIS